MHGRPAGDCLVVEVVMLVADLSVLMDAPAPGTF